MTTRNSWILIKDIGLIRETLDKPWTMILALIVYL